MSSLDQKLYRQARRGPQVLPRRAAVGPEATLLGSLIEANRTQTMTTLEACSDAELAEQVPGTEEGFTLAHLVVAIAREELRWSAETFCGYSTGQDVWQELGGCWGDAAWRSRPACSRERLLALLDGSQHVLGQTLRMSRDSALDADYIHPDGSADPAEGRWILYHVLTFEATIRGRLEAALDCVRA